MNAFHNAGAAATTVAELEAVVHRAIGASDLIEFVRFDSGDVLRKEPGGRGPRMLRLVSYDSMASLLAPYGNEAALVVARDLDAKIESLLETTAR
jgi:hypothetical protein